MLMASWTLYLLVSMQLTCSPDTMYVSTRRWQCSSARRVGSRLTSVVDTTIIWKCTKTFATYRARIVVSYSLRRRLYDSTSTKSTGAFWQTLRCSTPLPGLWCAVSARSTLWIQSKWANTFKRFTSKALSRRYVTYLIMCLVSRVLGAIQQRQFCLPVLWLLSYRNKTQSAARSRRSRCRTLTTCW